MSERHKMSLYKTFFESSGSKSYPVHNAFKKNSDMHLLGGVDATDIIEIHPSEDGDINKQSILEGKFNEGLSIGGEDGFSLVASYGAGEGGSAIGTVGTDDVTERNNLDDSKLGVRKNNKNTKMFGQVLGALAASGIQFGMATTLGLSGVLLPALVDEASPDLVLDPIQAALFCSIINIGALFGSLTSGPLMVWFGQRATLLGALPVSTAGWFLLAFAPTVWVMQVSRFLLGFITGIVGAPAMNYISEVSHPSLRGTSTGCADLFRQFGFMFVYCVGSSGISWRYTCVICGLVTTLLPFVLWFKLPNSPRWLVANLRNDEARSSLQFFRGTKSFMEEELNGIINEVQRTSGNSGSVRNQLKHLNNWSILKRMALLAFFFSLYPFTGNTVLVAYSTTIFQFVGSNINSYKSTIIASAVRILGMIANMVLADKIGRRPLLFGSTLLSSLFLGILATYEFFASSAMVNLSTLGWLPLLSLSCFIFFACGSRSILIVLQSELLPLSVRSIAMSFIYICFYSGRFLVSFVHPVLMETFGSCITFAFYSFVGILMVIVGSRFLLETRGKSLEDIELMYRQERL